MSLRDVYERPASRKQAKRSRGYCGVAAWRSKERENIGGLLRGAYVFDAVFAATIGPRYRREPADTPYFQRHCPLLHYTTLDDFFDHLPWDCQPIVAEICKRSRPLPTFVHPERAVYLFGPEDGSLPQEAIDRAHAVVEIPGRMCLNLAAAANVVLYDRWVKRHLQV